MLSFYPSAGPSWLLSLSPSPVVPNMCKKYGWRRRWGHGDQSSQDAAQALPGTPENCFREGKGSLLGSQAALVCCVNLLNDFKDNILLCQQRKVTVGTAVHS